MAKEGNGLTKLFSTIFGSVGLVLLAIAGWTGNRQYTILKSWPTVEAEVTKSRVTSSRDSEGMAMYGTEIEFRYTINGKEYLTPGSSSYQSSSYREMKRKAEKYPPGSRHSIHYNPADPEDIRFDVGYNFGFFFVPVLLGGMGVVFTAFGVGFLVASRSARAWQCPSCGQPVSKGQNFCPNCAAALSIN